MEGGHAMPFPSKLTSRHKPDVELHIVTFGEMEDVCTWEYAYIRMLEIKAWLLFEMQSRM